MDMTFTDDHAIRCDGCGNPIHAGETFWSVRESKDIYSRRAEYHACSTQCLGVVCSDMESVTITKDRLYTAEEKELEYADRKTDERWCDDGR